ncbi:unnamed protein product, partial [Rhizoctonia solani]
VWPNNLEVDEALTQVASITNFWGASYVDASYPTVSSVVTSAYNQIPPAISSTPISTPGPSTTGAYSASKHTVHRARRYGTKGCRGTHEPGLSFSIGGTRRCIISLPVLGATPTISEFEDWIDALRTAIEDHKAVEKYSQSLAN